jgi:microcystin-dependent protein
LTVGTNGQVLVGSTGADPVFATITDGEGIDTTAGAGTLTIACEDASTSNKGVTVYAGNTKALAGTDTASAVTPDDLKYVLGYHRHSGADLDGAGVLDYGVTTGTGTAYALSLSPPLEAYIEGLPIFFKAHVANTGAVTLNVDGLGAKSILHGSVTLDAGDIQSGQLVTVMYDGTNFQMMQHKRAALVPSGTVAYFAASSAPTGWLKCNGAAVSRTTYAALFAAIGTAFGVGDGSTTFNLPDLRGEFLRGFDDGRGIDSGRTFGSWQKGTLYSYDTNADGTWNTAALSNVGSTSQSEIGADAYNTSDYPNGRMTGATSTVTATLPGSSGNQGYSGVTRPRNVALLACIKY